MATADCTRQAKADASVRATQETARALTADELMATVGGRDAATGLPTGQRLHKPFVFVR